MKTHKDYSQSAAPQFDAVEDIKAYLGAERWAVISPAMAMVVDCEQFETIASFAGVEGFPVKAWYELYHGQGSWEAPDPDYDDQGNLRPGVDHGKGAA